MNNPANVEVRDGMVHISVPLSQLAGQLGTPAPAPVQPTPEAQPASVTPITPSANVNLPPALAPGEQPVHPPVPPQAPPQAPGFTPAPVGQPQQPAGHPHCDRMAQDWVQAQAQQPGYPEPLKTEQFSAALADLLFSLGGEAHTGPAQAVAFLDQSAPSIQQLITQTLSSIE